MHYIGCMILASISPYFANTLSRLKEYGGKKSLWQEDSATLIRAYESDLDTDQAIGVLQRARRMTRIFRAGLEHNDAFRAQYLSTDLHDWETFEEPPVPREYQDRLTDLLYIVRGPAEIPVLEIGDQARYIGARLFDKCVEGRLKFDVAVHDDNFAALLINATSEDGIRALSEFYLQDRADVTARILVQHNLPRWKGIESNPAKSRLYRKLLQPFREKAMEGTIRSVLTAIPTTRDAEVDGLPYEEYCDLYFKMCDQPWDRIQVAQKHLIQTLNAAKTLRFTNNDGTDLSMDVDGFTFCNSVIARNIPGSEVFSAPHIESTQGVIVAKGRFSVREDNGTIIENLRMEFEKGKLVKWTAEKGQEHFDHAVLLDEGSCRIGEIGIGTNPFLKQHVASILLSEKIGGSFHVALGDSYTMTDYMGDAVHVDNGNRSILHWDITTMLMGKQGRIYADDAVIMDDGIFLDPALRVLNEGWKAVPFHQRPQVWQKIYPEE